ncbi:MAG: hypothetical protein J4F43_04390 [Dehalococcoidia bacterium]|nr:hypothetical protein [Dehalococcoidia bacterium]
MQITETLYATSREAWREWLAAHHGYRTDIRLVCYKKGTGKPSVPYDDSVEEAICFGWVDGMTRSLDGERYALRFTPRKKRGKWAASNLRRLETMIALGKMTDAGLAAVPDDVLCGISKHG